MRRENPKFQQRFEVPNVKVSVPPDVWLNANEAPGLDQHQDALLTHFPLGDFNLILRR